MKKVKFIDVFIVFLLALTSGSLLNILGINEYLESFVFLFSFYIAVKNKLFKEKTFFLILVSSLFLILLLFFLHAIDFGNFDVFFNKNNIRFFLLFFSTILFSFYFLKTKKFINSLNITLYIIAIHAIFSCLLISFFPTENVIFKSVDGGASYVGYFNIFFQRNNVNYFGLLEPIYSNVFGLKLYRAHGVFWEPGNFAVYMNIFLFLNIYVFYNLRNILLSIIALVLAWSTIGFLVMSIQFIVYIFYARLFDKFFTIKILVVPIFIYLMSNLVIDNFEQKIYGDNSGSGASRVINTLVQLNVIYENPIIGTGFEFNHYQDQLNKSFRESQIVSKRFVDSYITTNASSTSSFLRLFSHTGLLIGLLLTYCLFNQTLITKSKYLFVIIFITSVSSAPLLFFPLLLIFVTSGVISQFLDIIKC